MAVRRGGVVVFLGGLGVDGRGHGDRLLLAAGWRVLGCGEDLRAGVVELHRRGPVRVLSAAEIRHGSAVVGRDRGVGYERRSKSVSGWRSWSRVGRGVRRWRSG